jgi:hypothetical protein
MSLLIKQLMKQQVRHRYFPLLLASCLLLSVTWLQAAEFTVRDAQTRLLDGVYHLEADIRYQLSDPIHEALANGVPITISLQVVVEQQRDYIWNKTLADLQQQYSVQYHALSGQYIIKDLTRSRQQSFRSLNSALLTLGEIHELPLLDQSLLKEPDAVYQVRLRSEIDINSLPAPLRPMAWLSREWKLKSEWFLCPLNS